MREHHPDNTSQLLRLDHESLTTVCSLLDPVSLATFSCTSRGTRKSASQTCLWEQLCRQRWSNLNKYRYTNPQQGSGGIQQASDSGQVTASDSSCQHPQQPTVDFRKLYGSNNRWSPLQLKSSTGYRTQLCPESPYDFCMSRAAGANIWSSVGDTYLTLSKTIELWSTGDSSQPRQRLASLKENARPGHCITEISAGVAAVGCGGGRICLYDLRPDPDSHFSPSKPWDSEHRSFDFTTNYVWLDSLQMS